MRSTNVKLFNSFFPPPSYLSLCPYSLDLSPDAVRLMYLKVSKHGLIPSEYKEVKLKEKCNLLETLEDLKKCDELRSVLVSLKEEYGMKFVNVSLPETKTYVFRTTLPKEALKTIYESISFKIEENVPLKPDEAVFDYDVLEKENDKKHVDVVVTTFPKSVVRTYTKLLNEVGLVPLSFESESQSLARALVKEDDPSSYLILNMAETKIGIAIVEQNKVQYTSSLPIVSKDVIEDLKGESADHLKKQINKLLIFWFTNKNDLGHKDKVDTVIISGKYASAPGLVDFLEKHLAIKIEVANVWKNCFDINEYVPDLGQKESLDFAIPIGLSLIHH
ncbi:MAG: Tfp pilus assembly PilM family ATPase [Candidatus Paceibacteria bacterium]|jgi:Tfp pilus assembly PilM family ATPase